jgi:hypothetical protein
MDNNHEDDQSPEQRKSSSRMPGFGLAIPLLIVAFVGYYLYLNSSAPKRTPILFSFFIEQLKEKNVEEVELGSRFALGKFRIPPELPEEPEPTSEAKAKSVAKTGEASPDEGKTPKPKAPKKAETRHDAQQRHGTLPAGD